MLQLSECARSSHFTHAMHMCWEEAKTWWNVYGMWWAVSVTAHAVVLSTVLLLMGSFARPQADATAMIVVDTSIAPAEAPIEIDPDVEQPPELFLDVNMAVPSEDDVSSLDAADISLGTIDGDGTIDTGDDSADSNTYGPIRLDVARLRVDHGGPNLNKGRSHHGENRSVNGILGRGLRRGSPNGTGRTRQSDKAVATALTWLARHQDADGRWSLGNFSRRCTDGTCACKAGQSDTAATALALLPFLATGQTHQSNGKYQQTISRGLYWLSSQQKSNGDLRSGSGNMYSHGLATITLCEAYGLSHDKAVGASAQQALNFVVAAQDPQGGGWRYEPRQPGDLSVAGWQLMALKSGMMAGLSVPSEAVKHAARFVNSMGDSNGGFGYTEPGSTLTMSAVGLLCSQYLGARQDDKVIRTGSQRLLANLPSHDSRNAYYWYYATQVMHNLYDSNWDTWNRGMRRVLVESQETSGCATGSWSPEGHPFADQGGRLMITALNTLSLEVYYRNLPLYKLAK